MNMLTALVFFSITITLVGSRSSLEIELVQFLMQNYSSSIHPTDHDTALEVSFNLRLLQVLSIDEKFQTITVQSYYQMRWNNKALAWLPEERGNVTNIWLPPNSMWMPDITLLNSADNNPNFIQKDTDTVKVDANGTCNWFPKVTLTASFMVQTFSLGHPQFHYLSGLDYRARHGIALKMTKVC